MASSGSPTSPSRPLLSLRTDAPAPLPSPSFSHWSSTQEGNLTSSPTHAAYPFPSLHFPSTSSLSFPADLPTPAHAAPPPPDSSTSSQRIFRQLELVKTLQEGIAREHSALEMIGLGECDWAAGTAGKEEGEKGRKESAQAYESMALEAEERHKGVEGIMEKVRSLLWTPAGVELTPCSCRRCRARSRRSTRFLPPFSSPPPATPAQQPIRRPLRRREGPTRHRSERRSRGGGRRGWGEG